GWRNAHPLIVDSSRRRDAAVTARRLTAPWLQTLDATLFPLKSAVDASINAKVAPFLGDVDTEPVAFATLVAANYLIAASSPLLDLYRLAYDKDALRRVEVPLGLNLGEYALTDYQNIHRELAALEV